ncbi:DUF1772 domain-containing protein [Sphingosinicella sp.]|uniref:DUF1772 domain-containing protein n=1 Tax=Sphingosinicella sp. TaxID=1917971 RepID=UPI0040379C63
MLAIAALTLAALFSGAALYVLFAEHPARGRIEPTAQLVQWKSAYAHGAVMQASLAGLSGLVGIAVWLRWNDLFFLAGGLVMLGAIAYTFAVMWQLNNRLKATPPEAVSAETVAMLGRWGRLHAGRTSIGLAATAIYAAGLYRALT